MHKAFWDYLEAQLNEDPPAYSNAIKMLSDIKEVRNKRKLYSLQLDNPSRMYYRLILNYRTWLLEYKKYDTWTFKAILSL